ncbi:MAG: ABC transporter substrate-binding protein [Frankia sp.]|nr:ABC transporter substrate-binding protein [Frankia sp.]
MPTIRSFHRRRLLQVAGLGLATVTALAACGDDSTDSSSSGGSGSAGETTSLSVQLSWIKDTEFAPLYIADDRGYYAEEGVSVDLIAGGPDIGAVEGIVASGSADIGIATDVTSVVAAAADGNPVVLLGALYQSNLHAFMSSPDNPITSIQDLVGKRLGGVQGVQPKFDAMFRLNGLEPDYTFVPVGYTADPVINGDVDAQSVFVTDEALGYERATGKKPALLSWQDLGLPAYTLVIFTTQDVLNEKRDAVKGFLEATRRGFDDDAADPTVGAKLAAEKYGADAGLTVEEEVAKNEAYLALASSPTTEEHGWLYVDADYLAGPIYEGMEASGMKTAPIEDVLDLSLLDELNADGGGA